jgi:hypothetical protein
LLRWGRLSGLLRELDRHPLRKLIAYVVAAAVGITAIWQLYALVAGAITPGTMPQALLVQPATSRELAIDTSKRSVEVIIQNPSDQMLLITGVAFRTKPLPSNFRELTSGPVLPSAVYTLPLTCRTKAGRAPLQPVFGVDPKHAAAFIVEADRKQMNCLMFLSFQTSQGWTPEELAKGF